MEYKQLMLQAAAARQNAYAPYSGYKVGAALITKSGKVYLGCNVENASFGETVCAERVAVLKAVSEGERELKAIAITGGRDSLVFCSPCGSCRQVLNEFCDGDFKVILGTPDELSVFTLGELLPHSFKLEE